VDYLHDEKTTEVFTIDGKLIGKWDGAKIVFNEEGKKVRFCFTYSRKK